MGSPEVWFAIPSANPEKCRATLPVWRKMGYKIAVLQNFERGDIPADLTLWSDEYPGWPASVNLLCRRVVPPDCPIVVTGGDDMLPDPNHTAQELARQFLDRFPDTFGVMQPHGDEFMLARLYCGSPFMGRAWFTSMYQGEGGMFPGYRHNWADNELYWLAKGMGALWERPDLIHHHEHFTRSGSQKPDYWKANVETRDLEDCRTYINRSWSRFPGHQPLPRPGAGPMPTFDSSVLAQGAMHLAEIRMAQSAYTEGVRAAWLRAMTTALDSCAGARIDPIALYGSGTHTRVVAEALMHAPVRIDCVIDDNKSRQGERLWNWPIVSRAQALHRGVRGVVFSANAHESMLWDNASDFLRQGVRVIRLYQPSFQELQTRIASALARCRAVGATRPALTGLRPDDLCPDSWLAHYADRIDCIISPDPSASANDAISLPVVNQREAIRRGVDAVINCAPDHDPASTSPHLQVFAREGLPIEWLFMPADWQNSPSRPPAAVGA